MTQHPKFIKLNIGPTIGTALGFVWSPARTECTKTVKIQNEIL